MSFVLKLRHQSDDICRQMRRIIVVGVHGRAQDVAGRQGGVSQGRLKRVLGKADVFVNRDNVLHTGRLAHVAGARHFQYTGG